MNITVKKKLYEHARLILKKKQERRIDMRYKLLYIEKKPTISVLM